jgi:predicted MFS family arabinose efflux permease
MLGYSLLFGPTITLTNAIALAHLKNASKEFGKVRVGGTLGWFVALGILSIWRATSHDIITGDLFLLSGGFAAVLGLYSFSLPATRPSETAGGVPFFQALALLRDRNFLLFGICSFVLGLTLDFYYIFMSAFLGTPRNMDGVGLASGGVPLMMMLPQVSEIFVMSTLGATLPRLGIKRALLIGFGAWIARFAILAMNPNIAAAAVALLLHGFCFVFVFAVASLYVNEVAHSDIRASAQALVTIGLFGFGRFFGSQLAGRVHDSFTQIGGQKMTSWSGMYTVACAMAIAAAIGLAIFFREPKLRSA